MRLYTTLAAIFFFLIPYLAHSQFAENIRTGRPGQSIGPFTLGDKVFQLQSGISYNRIDTPLQTEEVWLQNNVLRLGLTEKVELSAVVNLQSDQVQLSGEEFILRGISAAQLGGRINLTEQKGVIPTLALQGRLILPINSPDFQRDKWGSEFTLATGHAITSWLSLGSNWIIRWPTLEESPVYAYTLNTGFSLSDRWGAFLEVYGQLDDFSSSFDGGFSFLVNPDLLLDASAGWQGNESITDWFVDAGFSWRTDWR